MPPSWLTSRRYIDRGAKEVHKPNVNFRELLYKTNRPSRLDWFGLRYSFEPLSLFGPQKRRIRTGLERKVRVLTDWTLELFFPRDIVQTIDFDDSRMRQADPTMTTP